MSATDMYIERLTLNVEDLVNKKLDTLNDAMASLLVASQNQTRLIAINTLHELMMKNSMISLFPTLGSYGYNTGSNDYSIGNLCADLIGMLKAFNMNMGWAVAALTSSSKDSTACHNFIIACIHELTGMKPRLVNDSGNLVFWRE